MIEDILKGGGGGYYWNWQLESGITELRLNFR